MDPYLRVHAAAGGIGRERVAGASAGRCQDALEEATEGRPLVLLDPVEEERTHGAHVARRGALQGGAACVREPDEGPATVVRATRG